MKRSKKSNHQSMEKHPFYSKDQIAAYLSGKMSDEQTEAFEKLLDTDPFLEAIVEGMRLQKVAKQMLDEDPSLLEGYENLNHDRLVNNIRSKSYQFEFKPTEPTVVKKSIYSKRWAWQAAAATVLLVGLGAWGFYKNTAELKQKQTIAALAEKPLSNKDIVLPITQLVDDKKLEKIDLKNDKAFVKTTTQQIAANTQKSPKIPAKEAKKPIVNAEMQKLIAINNREIKYWEDELANYQNSRSSGETLSVISPVAGTKLSVNEVLFEVKYTGDDALYLTVYESSAMNKALLMEVPFDKVKNDQKFTHLLKNLKKGTYYWKVTSDEEELFIGKFKKEK
ncbi:hypothetical protein BKI52_20675 [marine bacterium AO1-C]|nr:hypothetical protein BKI52_20675 [marine bacterium AO1-C]